MLRVVPLRRRRSWAMWLISPSTGWPSAGRSARLGGDAAAASTQLWTVARSPPSARSAPRRMPAGAATPPVVPPLAGARSCRGRSRGRRLGASTVRALHRRIRRCTSACSLRRACSRSSGARRCTDARRQPRTRAAGSTSCRARPPCERSGVLHRSTRTPPVDPVAPAESRWCPPLPAGAAAAGRAAAASPALLPHSLVIAALRAGDEDGSTMRHAAVLRAATTKCA